MLFRIIVVGLIRNEDDEYLLCRMPEGRGVFPGMWGVPGGGVKRGERIETALRREMAEELGIEITDIKPMFFRDDLQSKIFPQGDRKDVYMIYLFFDCKVIGKEIKLNEEFSDFAWVRSERLKEYNLNSATVETFKRIGVL